MNIEIVEEKQYRSVPIWDTDYDMVEATIRVPKREWLKFKTHLEEVNEQERKRKEVFAEIFGIENHD